MCWGEHPEITHRRDERFPNRHLRSCQSKGAPLNPVRHQQNSLSTFAGGEHPEITHRRDERFPNRPLGVCHSQGAPLNPLRHQQHSLSTFVGANTQKSRIVVAKDSRKHASDVDSIRNNSMHSIIQRDMWHLRAATLVNALAVSTSFWAQHGPFEGRDTCERLSGFHIVLGATWAI